MEFKCGRWVTRSLGGNSIHQNVKRQVVGDVRKALMVVSVQRDHLLQQASRFRVRLGSLICVSNCFSFLFVGDALSIALIGQLENKHHHSLAAAAAGMLIVPWEMVVNVLSRLLGMVDYDDDDDYDDGGDCCA